jgi:Pro-kumamolisin, activation domain
VRVSAEVILVPRGGQSLTEGLAQVTAERIDQFRPDERVKAEVRNAFERRGFTVHDVGTTLTIEGEPQAFERAFGVRLAVNPHAAPGEPIATASGEPQVPQEVSGLVETVAFPKRAHLFGPRPRGEESDGEG